ncbi:MAG: DUF1553 domain-containing protein [Planctomycetaceae bacterium]
MQDRVVVLFVACWMFATVTWPAYDSAADDRLAPGEQEKLAFFETFIRPALETHCLECHSAETEASGGLLLDSRAGWQAGGDSGDAIVPGEPTQSRLLQAIGYDDPHLQMPPDGKLRPEIHAAFVRWIREGAVEPRDNASRARPQAGLPPQRAQEHWAYRELPPVSVPVSERRQPSSSIDSFIDRRLEQAGLEAGPAADHESLIRRLSYDLTGLPPAAMEPMPMADSSNAAAGDYEQWVDRLLASPHFGETFARHWMDVARYAESVTLRGFVLPEAWRYRDYLIESFNEDRPFNQMIREQVAGDLMQSKDLHERQMQRTATSFLAMGNTNLEQQDKSLLEMDYVDEQLDVIGRAFLAQTIGCARCHDHKFDPIPTRDYYALAGILRSSVALKHANLSQWIEQPLPLPQHEEAEYERLAGELAQIDQQIASIKKLNNVKDSKKRRSIAIEDLPGVIVDSSDAKLVGDWTTSMSVAGFVGDGYLHDGNTGKGMKTATFEPKELKPGSYQVRLAYSASTNRASNAVVRVFSADGEATVIVNQREQPVDDSLWISLGEYRFEANGQAFVLVSNADSDGHVIVDAVQFLPIAPSLVDVTDSDSSQRRGPAADGNQPSRAQLNRELQQWEARRKELLQAMEKRPRYLTIVEQLPPKDLPIHIRGDVHNLGDTVPRGFLTAIAPQSQPTIAANSSGRWELGQWLASDQNALTARVYANRVWCWLMGQGLVTTVNNFGTTGAAPTHPELLDWLAAELIRSGWSTKYLVRQIVMSDAYRRRLADPDPRQAETDPANQLYWRGHSRRLTSEALRDSMLYVSGELDTAMGGSLIRPGTKADYDYHHQSTRRTVYQPVFRNSLAPLLEAFDFADSSVSVGQRARGTVPTQALVLVNHPWPIARAAAAAARLHTEYGEHDLERLVDVAYYRCLYRKPTDEERTLALQFLCGNQQVAQRDRLQSLIHSLFASLDFRYLE